jgi:hypothetical protein
LKKNSKNGWSIREPPTVSTAQNRTSSKIQKCNIGLRMKNNTFSQSEVWRASEPICSNPPFQCRLKNCCENPNSRQQFHISLSPGFILLVKKLPYSDLCHRIQILRHCLRDLSILGRFTSQITKPYCW